MPRGRKKKNVPVEVMDESTLKKQRDEYSEFVMSSPKYCEAVDPENKYCMTDEQKQFVYLYIEMKSIQAVCDSMSIEFKDGMQIFGLYSVQQEIKRLTLAKLQRRTMTELWDYAMLESYLTSFLTDVDVPVNEQLSGRDKTNVVRMIIDIKEKRSSLAANGHDTIEADVDEELKKLSVDTILLLLKQDDDNSKKKQLIEKLKSMPGFDKADLDFINGLTVQELLQLLDKEGD